MRVTDGSVSPLFQHLRLSYGDGLGGLVGPQQRARPAHDGLQNGVEVAQGREVAGGVEERGEFGLPAAVLAQDPAHPQRGGGGLLQF
jgi:hypothetical protein